MKTPITTRYSLVASLTAILVASAVTRIHADPIVYGDMIGDQLTYIGITENSTTDPFPEDENELFVGLYGTPEMLGDALQFNVPTFAAQAVGGPALDLTDGFLTFALLAEDDMLLTRLFIEEFGSVHLQSPLGGSDITNVGIATPVFVDIQQVVLDDGTPEGQTVVLDEPITIEELSLQVRPVPTMGREVFGFASDPDVVSWVADLDVDLVAELIATRPDIDDNFPVRGVRRMRFNMNNTLSASAEDAFASAFIDKKQVSINPTLISNVPEPLAPFALLLLPLAFSLRRWSR